MTEKQQDTLRLSTIALLCLLNLGFGVIAHQQPMLLAGAVGLNYVILTAAAGRERAATMSQPQLA